MDRKVQGSLGLVGFIKKRNPAHSYKHIPSDIVLLERVFIVLVLLIE